MFSTACDYWIRLFRRFLLIEKCFNFWTSFFEPIKETGFSLRILEAACACQTDGLCIEVLKSLAGNDLKLSYVAVLQTI